MLFVSNYILNYASEAESIAIHPYVEQPSNVVRPSDLTRAVRIPDVCPAKVLGGDTGLDFSMCAGEFMEVYRDTHSSCVCKRGNATAPWSCVGPISRVFAPASGWDCVITCFFLDTAPVVLDYITTIFNILSTSRFRSLDIAANFPA